MSWDAADKAKKLKADPLKEALATVRSKTKSSGVGPKIQAMAKVAKQPQVKAPVVKIRKKV